VPFTGIDKAYIAESNDYTSLSGEGGYVFLFDNDLKLKDEGVEKTFAEFLDATIEAMYNPNLDCMVYNGIVFSYSPHGDLKVKINSYSFRRTPSTSQLTCLSIWILFYIYFTVSFF
jgi:hypothetical protein